MQLSDSTVLYHGSYCIVESPLLEMCEPKKDFGQGFYITTSYDQARRFVRASVRKHYHKTMRAEPVGDYTGYVSKYMMSSFQGLRIKTFPTTDQEWLHCIAAHRMNKWFPKLISEYAKYDVIIGKVADDNTNETLNNYFSEVNGKPGDEMYDKFYISGLHPENLDNQICLRTQEAIERLTFCGKDDIHVRFN